MYKLKGKITFILLVVHLLLSQLTTLIAAEEFNEELPKVVVIYSSQDDEINTHLRMIDILIGHYTNNVKFIRSTQVKRDDIDQADYVFYYGHQREILPDTLVNSVSNFSGVVLAQGYNIEQFGSRFSFVERIISDVEINQVSLVDQPGKQISFDPHLVLNIKLNGIEQTETLLLGKKESKQYPLFVKNQITYYFASNIISPSFLIPLAEVLHEVFGIEKVTKPPNHFGYIRLEDIHPLVDPEPLREIANILKEKNIPYMIAVIPVYINPETKEQHHFSDSPELLKVLRFMQENGGSIVLHGYTHQYRISETGEGFEFWDVEYNMPIYYEPDEEVIVKTRGDFNRKGDFEKYLSAQKAHERDYIEERLTKGIQELANYGLYPLAFEAPHYTMSQHGYKITSEFFTTYIGQVQLSDKNWETMISSPYSTKPTFLNGMLLLPETIGYVNPGDEKTIEKMVGRAEDYKFTRDSMISGFFHPYLGVDLFKEFITEMERIPQITWIDLKQINNRVRTKFVDIMSRDGEVIVQINYIGLFLSSSEYIDYHIGILIRNLLWLIAGFGSLGISSFIVYITFNIIRNRQINRGEGIG